MGWKAIWALCAALLLTGCMSSGTDVSDKQLDQFVRGKTTEAEVVTRLGAPTSRARSANGETVLSYNYMNSSFTAASFVPFVGPFLAGTNSKIKTVEFSFSRNGILTDWTARDNDTSVRNGILNSH